MLLTLEACQHATVVVYGSHLGRGTCMACYRRLRRILTDGDTKLEWQPDMPVTVCNHPNKKPIPDNTVRRKSYRDALCVACGCVLRHPDGPGTWQEVIINGLVIEEEPF